MIWLSECSVSRRIGQLDIKDGYVVITCKVTMRPRWALYDTDQPRTLISEGRGSIM